jgi:biotin operon repressor
MGNTKQIDKRFAVRFIDLWNVSDGQDEVAKKIGMSYEQVKAYAALLRNRGYKLSNMTDRAWQVQPKYVPSLAEIRAECKRIQAGWSSAKAKATDAG